MKRKRLLALILTGCLTGALAACGSQSGSSAATSSPTAAAADDTAAAASDGSLYSVTLGTTPWPTNMFYYLADEEGIFEKNGLDVSIQDFASTTESNNAFIGGRLDFVTMASSETISPYEDGNDYRIVLETDKSNGCEGLVATSDITTVQDLKGKTVATQLYSVDHMLLLTMLDQNGMSQDDINLVDMSIQEAGSAFISGQCDAACIWDPYFSQAKEAGGNVLFSTADNPDLITDVLGASAEICDEHPEVVQALVQSFFDAVDYYNENTDDAVAIMAEHLGVDADEFKSEIAGLEIPTIEEELTAFTPADDYSYWGYTQNTVRDFMYNLGAVSSNERDCGDMLDDTFVKAVAAASSSTDAAAAVDTAE
ncbi:MAG: ABC transporter substrate-binding protein [Lachnospiraceae bacterium]